MRSRPKISWTELAGARVGIWGLGVEGAANLERAQLEGAEPVLVDDHPGGPVGGREVLATGADGLSELVRCDLVVKTPGISRYRPEVTLLADRGVPVVGGLGLWMEGADRSRVVCITGTKGKSTTTSLCGHLLARLGYDVMVGGNLGRPPFSEPPGTEHDFWVIETSSFQATDLASSPAVVAVTSLYPDHLDWHGDAETYFADKLSACHQPGAEITIADRESPLLRRRAAMLGPRRTWVAAEATPPEWSGPLHLLGRHNEVNARIARACLSALGVPEATDEGALRDAAAGYRGLDSRLQDLGPVGGVDFIDDGLSTNVLPTLAALETFAERRLALLVGGHDRGIDYEPLARQLAGRHMATLVVTLPSCGPRIGEAVRRAVAETSGDGTTGPTPEVVDRPDMAGAVRTAFEWSEAGGIVLLSPAAPSFGQFRDYRQRSAAFAEARLACVPTS